MKQLIRIILLSLCIAFIACKKNPSVQSGLHGDPIKTERGTAAGPASSKSIGPAGGELISADGKIKLLVPAGAVTGNTEFKIQPIENTLDTTSSFKLAYRLLPEGVNFSKPISLTFKYNEQDYGNTTEDLLTIAWQQLDGSWKAVPASLNKQAKTLLVKTNHFSDWLITGEISLSARRSNLAPGESTIISVMGVNHDDDDLLAPLSPSGWSGTISSVHDWDILQGRGELVAADGNSGSGNMIIQKKYIAPTGISHAEKATVKVNVEGNISIPDSSAPGGKRVFHSMILLAEINIVATVYMIGSFGPIDINIGEVTALYSNGRINIAAHDANISVGLVTNGAGATGFPSGDITIPGNSQTNASYSLGQTQSFSFGSSYQECNPTPVVKYSGGEVKLLRWGAVGEPVEGEFNGLLYMADGTGPNGCPVYDPRMLSIRFRTVRAL